MKISQEVREYARDFEANVHIKMVDFKTERDQAKAANDSANALAKEAQQGMKRMSQEFKSKGSEIYHTAK